VPIVLKALLEGGDRHGECLTVNGRTMAENLSAIQFPKEQLVVHTTDAPLTSTAEW